MRIKRQAARVACGMAVAIATVFTCHGAFAADAAKSDSNAEDKDKDKDKETYDQDSVLKDAVAWFGKGSEGLGKVIEKAFKDHGRPNGYIKGEEAGGAITVGLRYGSGTLHLKSGGARSVHWQGPSIG